MLQQLPDIQSLLLYLERKGRLPNTLEAYRKNLILLAQRANLKNPIEVELAVARYKLQDPKTKKPSTKPASNSYKSKLCDCYAVNCRFFKIEWEKPIYTPEPPAIQVPTRERTSMFVASAKGDLSIKLDIVRQTGCRPIEIQGEKGLRVKGFHPDQPSLTNRNTKKCNARPAMPITQELATRIATHIRQNNLQMEDLLFKGDSRRFGEHYRRFRNKLANKLQDQSIKSIRLYDLRHFYCTEKLRRIQNCEIVRQLMGHKNLNPTQKYMHLLPNLQSREYEVEYTNDKVRAKILLLTDFKYELTTPDGYMMFRRPK